MAGQGRAMESSRAGQGDAQKGKMEDPAVESRVRKSVPAVRQDQNSSTTALFRVEFLPAPQFFAIPGTR